MRAGQTLIIALIVLGVLLAVGLVFLGIVGRNVAQTAANRLRSVASDLGDAGVRYAHQQLLRTTQGADWRPTPTAVTPVTSNPDITRDPDILYTRPGTNLGMRSDTDPQLDLGGPDGLGAYTRLDFPNGRALIRVRYAPSDANIFSSQPTGPLRNPGRARMYTIIESVGRPRRITFNDPTSGNSGVAVQFKNFATSNDFRLALSLMRKNDAQIVLSSKTIAFVSIGIVESGRYITNLYKVSRPADFGIPADFGGAYKGVNVSTGKDIVSGAQVTTPLALLMGVEGPLYNFGTPPTLTAMPVGFGGSLFSNADLRVNGQVIARLNTPLGDTWDVDGLIYGADSLATLTVERNYVDPATGAWQPPINYSIQNGTNPSLNSRSTEFDTIFGLLRDAIPQTDRNGYQRGIGQKPAPSAYAQDPETGLTRYVYGTRESGALVGTGNSGRFGYGSGVYVDNYSDRQVPADEEGRAQVGTSQSLAYDWLNPNNGQTGSGWQGPFYIPRGAYMLLVNDGFYITRDSRAPDSQRYWKGPGGGAPVDLAGNAVQTGRIRYRIGLGGDGLPHIVNTFTPDPTDPTHALDIDAADPDFDAGPIFNGVVYFEGNVRVRGVIPMDVQLTVVSNTTVYVEGSITKGVQDNTGARLNRPSKSMMMLSAHDYTAVNTTQFFGSSSSQALEEVNDTQSAIAYNPVRMRVGGAPLRFVTEIPLDPTANPGNPQLWRPYALDYREYVGATVDTGAPIAAELLLTHTMDDGPAPATYFSMDVNYGVNKPGSPGGNQDWVYQFELTTNNAATQPYIDFGSALGDYKPIYGLGVETWQRYSRFESIGYPLIRNDYTYNTTQGYLLQANGAIGGDPEGDYVLFTDATNEITIRHNNVGSDPTNDYLLARAAMIPGDVRIEASMYAETGSFFVIPGPSFNPNPNDRRDVFEQAVTTYGGFGSEAAIRQAQQERLENYGSFPQTPFYGEPVDVRVAIVGSISENMPAPLDQQAQWIKRWGWIPAQQGGRYDFSGATPRPVLIPKSHVPAGYDINPGSTSPALYVPNLIVNYDPVLATARINGFDTSATNLVVRQDEFGRTLPPLPRLPVSSSLAYFGEVNP
jgi:hypothetical protein